MLKRNIRWIIPAVIVIAAIVAFVVAPAMSAHAATVVPYFWGGQ